MPNYNQINVGDKFLHRDIYGLLIPCKVVGKSIVNHGGKCYQVRIEYDERHFRNTNERECIILRNDGVFNTLIPAK